MKSKYTTRSSSRSGNTMTNNFARAIVKGGPAKKKVKTMIYSTTTDFDKQKTTGKGKIRKRVYKKGVLVKDKTKKMSMRKMLMNP